MNKDRTLIVSIVDFPEGLAHSQFIKKYAHLFKSITEYVEILIAYPPGVTVNNIQKHNSIDGINYHYYKTNTPQNILLRLYYRIFSIIFYLKQLKTYRLNIKYVVLIGTTLYDDFMFILYKYIYRYEIVYVIADDVTLVFDDIREYNIIKSNILRIKYALTILQMYSYKIFKPYIITVSTYLKETISHFVCKEKITIIPTICSATIKNDDKKYNIKYDVLYAGNITNYESLDFLVDAFTILKKIYHKKLNIAIYGAHNNNKENVKELFNKITSNNLDDIINIYNIIPRVQLDPILKSSMILVLPRNDTIINKAGFSGKIVDYMLSGRPVVATDVGDLSLYYKNKREIMLSPAGDKDKFAKNILKLLNDSYLAEQIGINGYNKTLSLFNVLNMRNKIIKMIKHR